MAEFYVKTIEKSRKHDAEHYEGESINTIDPSCLICHPVMTRTNEKFQTFMTWYREFMPVRVHTEMTIQLFRELLKEDFGNNEGRNKLCNKLWSLAESMRYNNRPKLSDSSLIQEMITMFFYSKNFTINMEEAKKAVEEALKSNPPTQKNTPNDTPEERGVKGENSVNNLES